jgi:hypothetical protein
MHQPINQASLEELANVAVNETSGLQKGRETP